MPTSAFGDWRALPHLNYPYASSPAIGAARVEIPNRSVSSAGTKPSVKIVATARPKAIRGVPSDIRRSIDRFSIVSGLSRGVMAKGVSVP